MKQVVEKSSSAPAAFPLWKRIIFSCIAIFLSIALLLAALEIFLRLPKKFSFAVDTSNMMVRSDIPGLEYRLARNYSNGGLQTDEFGFLRHPHTHLPVGRSILLLGDSVAFAGGVRYEDSFASLLEKQLTQAIGRDIVVHNSGTPGYNTVQEELLFKDLQKSVHPNLVILQFCMNDYLDPVALTLGNNLDATSTGGGQFSLLSILYRSRALFYLKEKLKDMEKLYPERFPAALHYVHYIRMRSGWQRAKDSIQEIASTAEQMHAQFLLVIFPVEQQLRIPDRTAQDDLIAFAKSRNIKVLDLYPVFAKHWREGLFFDYSVEQHVVDKIHLNKRGHELTGAAIAASIVGEPVLRDAVQ